MRDDPSLQTDMYPAPENPLAADWPAGANTQTQSNQADIQCRGGGTITIVEVYWGIETNPDGLSWAQQIHACYDKHGITDGRYMSDDQCYWDPTGSGGMTIDQAQAAQNQRDQDLASTTPIAAASTTPK